MSPFAAPAAINLDLLENCRQLIEVGSSEIEWNVRSSNFLFSFLIADLS